MKQPIRSKWQVTIIPVPAIGALAGVAGGWAIEQRRATRPGLEIEVEFHYGRVMAILQEADSETGHQKIMSRLQFPRYFTPPLYLAVKRSAQRIL